MRGPRPDQQHTGQPGAKRRRAKLLTALLLGFAIALPPAVPGAGLSPTSYKQLAAIHEYIDRQAYDLALQSLERMLAGNSLNTYDTAVTLQTLAYVQISRENYPAAIHALEQSLALEQLPEQGRQRLRYDLAQLYLAEDRIDAGIALLTQWLAQSGNPTAEAYALLANAHARQRQYRQAVPLLQRAIALSPQAPPDWYEALLAMHYELESFHECVSLLEDMLRMFPQRSHYWRQLAAVHMNLDDHAAALTALELAYRDGALQQEQDFIQLAGLYLYTGVPYKAATLVAEQIDSGRIGDNAQSRELLARAWSDARERHLAIGALERAIATDSRPELRLRLAQWYLEQERWRAVARVLEPLADAAAGDTGARAGLMLGIAQYESGNPSAARQALLIALRSEQTRSPARQWLDFIDARSHGASADSHGHKKKRVN